MVLVLKLDEYEWGYTDENIACLIDREDYWLNAEYQSWTTDPEDPEVKKPTKKEKNQGSNPHPSQSSTPSPTAPSTQQRAGRRSF